MTAAERSVLWVLSKGPVCYLQVGNADWPAAVELGKAGLVRWDRGTAVLEITKTGRAALAEAEAGKDA
jgi:hypothetical protein